MINYFLFIETVRGLLSRKLYDWEISNTSIGLDRLGDDVRIRLRWGVIFSAEYFYYFIGTYVRYFYDLSLVNEGKRENFWIVCTLQT